jgi:hypothetical protein
MNMRLGKLLFLFGCVGIAVLFLAASDGMGRATRVVKTVDLLRGKSSAPLKEQDPIAENDRIRTQSSGRARVVLTDGSILNVGASTLFTVKSETASTRAGSLEMAYGRIRAEIVARVANRRPFEVRTATAVCGVLGTTVFLDASRDLTRIANLSDDATSLVRVVSTDARAQGEVTLRPGEGTSVPARGAPQPPRRWSVEEVRAAQQDTLVP